jgi:hypothetical protein
MSQKPTDDVGIVMRALNCKAATAKKLLRGNGRMSDHNRKHGPGATAEA